MSLWNGSIRFKCNLHSALHSAFYIDEFQNTSYTYKCESSTILFSLQSSPGNHSYNCLYTLYNLHYITEIQVGKMLVSYHPGMLKIISINPIIINIPYGNNIISNTQPARMCVNSHGQYCGMMSYMVNVI